MLYVGVCVCFVCGDGVSLTKAYTVVVPVANRMLAAHAFESLTPFTDSFGLLWAVCLCPLGNKVHFAGTCVVAIANDQYLKLYVRSCFSVFATGRLYILIWLVTHAPGLPGFVVSTCVDMHTLPLRFRLSRDTRLTSYPRYQITGVKSPRVC